MFRGLHVEDGPDSLAAEAAGKCDGGRRRRQQHGLDGEAGLAGGRDPSLLHGGPKAAHGVHQPRAAHFSLAGMDCQRRLRGSNER
jgi:hypothetical protein